MQPLTGAAKRYDWGSPNAIPEILGIPSDGRPVAEYWLGAHPSAPALVGGVPLDRAIDADPAMIGYSARHEFDGRLPFLLKLLSAARPLSLQAHPNDAQAAEGFARENAADIPLDALDRTFKDPWAKPEMLVALTEFDALAGFRDPAATLALFDGLGLEGRAETVIGPLRHRTCPAALAEVFLDCLILDDKRRTVLTDVVVAAVNHVNDPGELGEFARTAVLLDEHFPGDPSLLAALLLHRRRLRPGEALHVAPGVMHAYLEGTGVEIMATSDNVLRGGLTSKHIDAYSLVQVVDFSPGPMPVLQPSQEAPGLWFYAADERAFALWRLELVPGRSIEAPAESSGRIVLATDGEIGLSTGSDGLVLRRGQSAFVSAGESVVVSGQGQAFLAATGLDA
ncbi:mannose-6-phosphate isomerase, class I [Brooklawnia cerclae]|nr:mannose-6-phosphate isomerase, class I [Brooklawnia cerclae]